MAAHFYQKTCLVSAFVSENLGVCVERVKQSVRVENALRFISVGWKLLEIAEVIEASKALQMRGGVVGYSN